MKLTPASNFYKIAIISYFMVTLIFAPSFLLGLDSYYYWDWSRHLSLSYFDGAPMIAYLIKGASFLFGDTNFAISFIGIITTFFASIFIYKSALFFLNKEASLVASVLWLFSPLIALSMVTQITYDAPLVLFWTLTIYFSIKYIYQMKIIDLYALGVSAGLMMLSKYSGIVLIFSLFVYLIISPYRFLFRSKHFYLAIFIAICIFSPVLIWNYQHDWVSFIYQLNAHQIPGSKSCLENIFHAITNEFLPFLNFSLLHLFLCKNNANSKMPKGVYFCIIISVVFIVFYLFVARHAYIRGVYLAPYLITASLLGGYMYQKYYKSTIVLLVFYFIASLMIIFNSRYNFINSVGYQYYGFIREFNQKYPLMIDKVYTSGWMNARILFFLQNKPKIFTLPCGDEQNQYEEWSLETWYKIKNRSMNHILFFDFDDKIGCVKQYFSKCDQLYFNAFYFRQTKYPLTVYRCQNAN